MTGICPGRLRRPGPHPVGCRAGPVGPGPAARHRPDRRSGWQVTAARRGWPSQPARPADGLPHPSHARPIGTARPAGHRLSRPVSRRLGGRPDPPCAWSLALSGCPPTSSPVTRASSPARLPGGSPDRPTPAYGTCATYWPLACSLAAPADRQPHPRRRPATAHPDRPQRLLGTRGGGERGWPPGRLRRS